MTKKKNRSGKKYVPRSRDDLKLRFEPWRVAAVFAPLEAILAQGERDGTVYVYGDDDRPMFRDPDGNWYDSVAALAGLVDAFEIHEARAGVNLGMEPLRLFRDKLDSGTMIEPGEADAVRDCMTRMRCAALDMTIGEARQLIKDFNIKEEMEKLM